MSDSGTESEWVGTAESSSESEEENSRTLGEIRENQTIGKTRRRAPSRRTATSSNATSPTGGKRETVGKSGANDEGTSRIIRGGGAASNSNPRRKIKNAQNVASAGAISISSNGKRNDKKQEKKGSQEVNTQKNSAAAAAAISKNSKPARSHKQAARNTKKTKSENTRQLKGKGKGKLGRSEVVGLLGVPIRGWNAGDSDYDDSEDETYTPPLTISDSDSSPVGPANNASSRSNSELPGKRERTATNRGRKNRNGEAGTCLRQRGEDLIGNLSMEVIMTGIIRPYLRAPDKCALQRTCLQMRKLIDDPDAWESLDLRAEVIGTRTLRSGRKSHLSNQPLFFLARSIVVQPRFSRVKTVDLRGMNLGAMGSSPDLLLKLFDNCPRITSLNLWGAYLESRGLALPDCVIEKVVAEKLPGVRHLALEMDASNKGLRVLLEGCRQLKSLHIGSRSNQRGDSVSLYPNDLGMKTFSAVGAPCLETLSLFEKGNIGPSGLRCLLAKATCPRLQNLVLTKMDRVSNPCLKAIAPDMERLRTFVVDDCPIKPSGIQSVIERCPDLRSLVVAGQKDVILDNAQEGQHLLDLFTESPTKLQRFTVEVRNSISVTLRASSSSSSSRAAGPTWLKTFAEAFGLRYDAETCAAASTNDVSAGKPRLVISQCVGVNDRIARLMASESETSQE